MNANERVTWETCPTCARCAAVGWRDGTPVGVDCPGGCRVDARTYTRRPPTVGGIPATVARWATAANV